MKLEKWKTGSCSEGMFLWNQECRSLLCGMEWNWRRKSLKKRVALSASKNVTRERNGSNKNVCENGREEKVVVQCEEERERMIFSFQSKKLIQNIKTKYWISYGECELELTKEWSNIEKKIGCSLSCWLDYLSDSYKMSPQAI